MFDGVRLYPARLSRTIQTAFQAENPKKNVKVGLVRQQVLPRKSPGTRKPFATRAVPHFQLGPLLSQQSTNDNTIFI